MRAAICERYGGPEVLRVVDLPTPVPRAGQVRVRVRASAVTSSDCFLRGLRLPLAYRIAARATMGLRRPRVGVLGLLAAGDVDAVGADVRNFRPGDRVYAFTGTRFRCHAEYVCVPADGVLALMPGDASYVDAAAVPYGGLMGSHFLRRAAVRPGERVLVNGASGAVGTSAVQLASHLGAVVTGVCGPTNADLVKSLGAVDVIDYTTSELGSRGAVFDLVLDAVGKTSRAKAAAATAPGGRFVSVNNGTPKFSGNELARLTGLCEAGALRPVVDRVYPLEEIAEAHRYVETGHKRGNVIVTID